uniref:TauD/TfdA-like domain-containing protein n=1 Tax=Spongospora subterranea TaxID=70186 RepID=A0A0H5QZK1_9EUKA|eukprot:CRZ07398.1 hypothetical protein [Spongospora subterranea]
MAITGGMAYIVLFAVFQSIWLVTNCQEKTSPTGIVRIITGADAGLRDFTEEKITLIPMEKPTNMELINILNLPNKFGVSRMTEQLKTMIDPLISLPHKQFRNEFANIIQKVLYEEISEEHSNWIVIPLGISKLSTDEKNVAPAHMDLLRDADVAALLQKYDDSWTIDIMEFLAKNNHVQTSALKHYNGNVEKYAMEKLTLDHLMNIWIPTKPVQEWPLALTPATQCDETRTKNGPYRDGSEHQVQFLLTSETTKNDWYTRLNMQPNEFYVWDSKTVAHAAVKIGDGKGERSYIACRLLIVHPNEDLSSSVSSPSAVNTLCYTESLRDRVEARHDRGPTHTVDLLKEMGYSRLCEDAPSALPLLPGYSRIFAKLFAWFVVNKL